MMRTEELNLTTEWDKTFPESNSVEHKKVTFVNRYGITLSADWYKPKNAEGKLPALAVLPLHLIPRIPVRAAASLDIWHLRI